jgi:hypothetical protein
MDKLLYQAHEARRHTHTIREIVQRACQAVFTGPKTGFRVKDGSWYQLGPGQQLIITVFQKPGFCRHQPVCVVKIERPKTPGGMYDYTRASATFQDPNQQAGNTRLVGHLQHQCPFLPKLEVTLEYSV